MEFAYRPELWEHLFEMVALAAVTLTGLLSVALSINLRAIVKFVQLADVDANVSDRKSSVVKTALRDAADERHLAAFKADADAAAGTRGLAFAAATAGFAVAAGFTLAQPFPGMPGAGTRFKVM